MSASADCPSRADAPANKCFGTELFFATDEKAYSQKS